VVAESDWTELNQAGAAHFGLGYAPDRLAAEGEHPVHGSPTGRGWDEPVAHGLIADIGHLFEGDVAHAGQKP